MAGVWNFTVQLRDSRYGGIFIADRLRSLVVHADCLLATDTVALIFAPTESIRALGLHLEKIAGALLLWGVFVGLTRLHDFLQAFAFRSQLIHHSVLRLKSVLEIIDHSLLNFFKLFDSHLVGNSNALMLCSLFLLHHRNVFVIVLSTDVLVLGCVSPIVKLMIALHDLLLLVAIFWLEALICDVLALSLQILALLGILRLNIVLVVSDALNIGISSLVIELPLIVFLVLQAPSVPILHCVVLISSLSDLVCELWVLLGNLDLFLQTLLLIVKFSESILQHLCLNLLLLHVKFLGKFARASYACHSCLFNTLRLIQFIKLDISKPDVMADKLLCSNFFRPILNNFYERFVIWDVLWIYKRKSGNILTQWMHWYFPRPIDFKWLIRQGCLWNDHILAFVELYG